MSSVSSTDGGYSFYQKPLDDLENETKDETKRARERYEDRADRLEKFTREALEKQNRQGEEAANHIRDESADRVAQDRELARQAVERERALSYDRNGRAQKEIIANKKEAESQVQNAMDIADHRVKTSGTGVERQLEKQAGAYEDRLNENQYKDRMSREKETAELRKDIHTLTHNEGNYIREKGQGTTDAYRELENENRTRNEIADLQYRRQLEGYKESIAAGDRHNAQMMDEALRGREEHYTGVIQTLNMNNHEDQRDLLDRQNRMFKEAELSHQKSQAADDAKFEAFAQKADQSKNDALASQDQIFKAETHDYRVENSAKLKEMEEQLHAQRTTDDETKISPAAERKFRNSVMQSYEKNFAAEQLRNKDRANALQEGYAKKAVAIQNEDQKKFFDAMSQKQIDEHLERQAYFATLDDVQKNHEIAIKNKNYENEKQVDHISRNYETTMDRQRRELEEQFADAKNDSQLKMSDLRQQHLFEARMAQKEFNTRQSELVRSYEKKLDEQKALSDNQITTLKEQMAHEHNETQRRTKQMLDEQSKGYEQKIAQLEYASKERERTISENYQDQIDKLKRSNALIIQRRSEKS